MNTRRLRTWPLVFLLVQLLPACGDEKDGSTIVVDGGSGQSGAGGSGAAGAGGTAGAGGVGGINLDAAGGTGGMSADGAPLCGEFGDDADCKACMQRSCCSQGSACNREAECSALVACAGECENPSVGTTPCVQACAGDHADGISAFNAALLCMEQACKTECSHL